MDRPGASVGLAVHSAYVLKRCANFFIQGWVSFSKTRLRYQTDTQSFLVDFGVWYKLQFTNLVIILVKQLFLHNPFLNLSVRLHYRSMQLCWHWTHSRSSTADFPTLGKYIIFSSDCGAPVCCFSLLLHTANHILVVL